MPTAVCIVSRGLFHSRSLLGDLLAKYPVILTASGHRSSGSCTPIRIARALVSITPPDRSAAPFCAGVYGADRSTVIPFPAVQSSKSFSKDLSPSTLMIRISWLYRLNIHASNSLIVERVIDFFGLVNTWFIRVWSQRK